jgi:hypothetical protein
VTIHSPSATPVQVSELAVAISAVRSRPVVQGAPGVRCAAVQGLPLLRGVIARSQQPASLLEKGEMKTDERSRLAGPGHLLTGAWR